MGDFVVEEMDKAVEECVQHIVVWLKQQLKFLNESPAFEFLEKHDVVAHIFYLLDNLSGVYGEGVK